MEHFIVFQISLFPVLSSIGALLLFEAADDLDDEALSPSQEDP